MVPYILAIDAGTTSSRAIVFDKDTKKIGLGQFEFTQHFPDNSWVEHDANEIWATQQKAFTAALKAAKIKATAMIRWAVRKEMAMTLEDMLSRRHRALLFDAKEARRIAPEVAAVMAKHLGKDENWIQAELAAFDKISSDYLVT